MQIHFFTIPIHDGSSDAAELNRLLASHRVVDIRREFVSAGPASSWEICVTTTSKGSGSTEKKGRVDYREVLSESDFALFAQLRTLRKKVAEREGVPPYALFNNEHLADMVRQRVSSVADLKAINGIGPARIEKYGELFVAELANAMTSEAATPVDSPPASNDRNQTLFDQETADETDAN